VFHTVSMVFYPHRRDEIWRVFVQIAQQMKKASAEIRMIAYQDTIGACSLNC